MGFFLLPSRDERSHLSRFYLATFFSEATNLSLAFRVMLTEQTLGVECLGPLLAIEQLAALILDVPTGAWADQFGRKRCVLLGHIVVMLGMLSLPCATWLSGVWQLIVFMFSFAMIGTSAALFSGAYESWVVDNLRYHGRRDLTARYFGRERSVAYVGGIIANLAALCATYYWDVDVRWFWAIGGLGELLAVVILWRTAEHPRFNTDLVLLTGDPVCRDATFEDEDEDHGPPQLAMWATLRDGLRVIVQRPALVGLTMMLVWFSAAFGVGIETIQASLSEGDLAKYGFSGLDLAVDILGALAAMAAVALAARCGARPVLAASILLPGLVAVTCVRGASNIWLAGGYLLAQLCACFLYTVSDEERHRLLPSSSRATTSSAMNFLSGLALIGSSGLLWLLTGAFHFTSVQALAVMGACALPAAIPIFLSRFQMDATVENGAELLPSGRIGDVDAT